MENFNKDWFDVKKAYQMWIDGYNINQIAKSVGCAHGTVKNKLEVAYPKIEFGRPKPRNRSSDYLSGYNAGYKAGERSR